jgi:beta-phosphoglucomutase family hydrolase
VIAVLGLPDTIRACLFDLDGVLTPTAELHATAWKEMFDAFLAEYEGPAYQPFDPVKDYDLYVDGKPRADGTRSFLAARGIELPQGTPDDPPEALTVEGLSTRKDALFEKVVRQKGVRPYPGSVRYLHAVRDAGLRRAVVSSSKHCAEIVRAAGLEDLLEVRVDGIVAQEQRLIGKPAPDTFAYAARELGVGNTESVVFEDALAGVEAGRAGRFGYVVGVDRSGEADALRAHGADTVVTDLAQLLDRS